MFKLFQKARQVASIEQWATHNSKKATADDLIAGAIVASFAKNFKQWKFEGEFNQKHSSQSYFQPTTLSFQMPTKKHINIHFIFKKKDVGGQYESIYQYRPIGCEVNGIRVTDDAFRYIYKGWNNIVVQVRATEEAADRAKKAMEENESKWDLAEALLGMKRDGLGRLSPIKTVEAE